MDVCSQTSCATQPTRLVAPACRFAGQHWISRNYDRNNWRGCSQSAPSKRGGCVAWSNLVPPRFERTLDSVARPVLAQANDSARSTKKSPADRNVLFRELDSQSPEAACG